MPFIVSLSCQYCVFTAGASITNLLSTHKKTIGYLLVKIVIGLELFYR